MHQNYAPAPEPDGGAYDAPPDSLVGEGEGHPLLIIIIIIISTKIFIVLSSWQSHCESSLGSRDEYSNGARWPSTFGPSQSA